MQDYLLMTFISLIMTGLVIYLSDSLIRYSKEGIDEDVSPERPVIRFSIRNVIVLVLTVGVGLYLVYYKGANPETYAIYFFIISFILIGVIDFEHHLILDILMIPLFIIALLELFIIRRVSPLYAFSGFAISQFFVMGIFLMGRVFLWLINSGRIPEDRVTEVPFGFGDVTLASYCGLVVGLPYVVVMLFLMIVVGGIIALLSLVVGHLASRYRSFSVIPYGPAIVIAATIMLIWGDYVMQALGVVY